jgi:hypothetical protein
MTFTRRAVTLVCILLPMGRAQSVESPVVELHVASDGDALGFVPTHLICPSGARVRLFLHHAGEIIDDVHDWVLPNLAQKARLYVMRIRNQTRP